jgi:hypothetical protein
LFALPVVGKVNINCAVTFGALIPKIMSLFIGILIPGKLVEHDLQYFQPRLVVMGPVIIEARPERATTTEDH